MKATVISKIIAYGNTRYRLNPDGNWSALAFGFPIGHTGNPIWNWIQISEKNVPQEVIKLAKKEG